MWKALYYVNHQWCSQQWNWNQDIIFPNSSIYAKLGFLSFGLGFTSKVFPIHTEVLVFLNVALAALLCFFPVYDKDRKLDFLNKSGLYF